MGKGVGVCIGKGCEMVVSTKLHSSYSKTRRMIRDPSDAPNEDATY